MKVRHRSETCSCDLIKNSKFCYLTHACSLHVSLDVFAKLCKTTISFVMSVRLSAWNNLVPIGRIPIKFDIGVFFENMSRELNFYSNLTKITGTLHAISIYRYICSVQLGSHPVAVVQYTFTHKQYTERHKTNNT